MASFALKHLFCFIVAVFLFNEQNVEAREGKLFFSKFTQASAPELAQEANGRLGDGPFGAGSGMIPQTKESWPVSSITTDAEFEKLMDTFEKGNELPEEFEEEEEESLEDVNEKADDKYRRGYGKEEERSQGMMSDTRFMEKENGKYFYDTRGMSNYDNGYNDHSNEFETMDEYYKSLEGSQEEYEP